jgi:uncharacterized membrane protein
LGLLPEQILLVYFGSSAQHFKDLFAEGFTLGQKILFVLEVIISVTLFIGFIFLGRKALKEAITETPANRSKPDTGKTSIPEF